MAWIESHQELARHPKAKKLARLLGVSLPAAIGHLHFFWWWAMDYAQDGDISKYDPEDIADASGWDGSPDIWYQSLLEAEFIDSDKKIHDWFDYAGRLVEKREQNKERKRRSRVKKTSLDGGHAGVTRDGSVTDDGVTGLPNLTEPKEEKETAFARVLDFYQRNIGIMAPSQYEYVDDWLETFDSEVLIYAMRLAVDRGVPKWVYVNRTLEGWQRDGAKNLDQCKALVLEFERKTEPKKQSSKTPQLDLFTPSKEEENFLNDIYKRRSETSDSE